MTHDIHEARIIGAKAEGSGLITQMGTQLTSNLGERIAVEWVRGGVIGKIREVFLWSNKPPLKYRPEGPRPPQIDPVPADLDWEGWLGTAPERPYVSEIYHPKWWRGWQDFGCGWLGDMGCHIMDMPFRALSLDMPLSARAEVEPEWVAHPERRVETFPRWQIVEYLYPGTELTAGDTVKITWSDGGKYPADELRTHIEGAKWPEQGALVLGEQGAMMMEHGAAPRLYPRERFAGTKAPELAPQDHYHQFIDAILGKDGGRTHSPFPYAARSTEMVLMGTIALRFPGQKLAWDAAAMRFRTRPMPTASSVATIARAGNARACEDLTERRRKRTFRPCQVRDRTGSGQRYKKFAATHRRRKAYSIFRAPNRGNSKGLRKYSPARS